LSTAVAVHDASGASLSAYVDGTMIMENIEDLEVPPRYLKNVSHEQQVRLFIAFVEGREDELRAQNWTDEA
jgi:hypothetical protein